MYIFICRRNHESVNVVEFFWYFVNKGFAASSLPYPRLTSEHNTGFTHQHFETGILHN